MSLIWALKLERCAADRNLIVERRYALSRSLHHLWNQVGGTSVSDRDLLLRTPELALYLVVLRERSSVFCCS